MTQIHWASQVSGNFTISADWKGGVVPGASDDAILDASGATPYTVTVTSTGTVSSIQTAATATLSIASATFTATNGSGSGGNAGTIAVGNGAGFDVGGTVANTGAIDLNSTGSTTTVTIAAAGVVLNGAGALTLSDSSDNFVAGATYAASLTNVNNTISGAGYFGNGRLLLVNDAAGVIDATGTTHALVINTGNTSGDSATNAGLIETTGAGGLTFANTTLTNTGTVKAAGTGALTVNGAAIANGTGGVISTVSGAHISLRSGAIITGGSLSVVAGASLTADSGGSYISVATFTNAGTVGITNGDGLSVGGTVANTGAIGVNSTGSSTTLTIKAAGVVLNGAGVLSLSDNGGNIVIGAAYGANLTNVNNTITGAGNFGDGRLVLINDAAGVIDATGTKFALIINTGYGGGDSATNAGLIETTGAGGLTFSNTTLTNTGTVKATGTGALTLSGATIANGAGGVVSTVSGAHISLRSGAITGGSLGVVAGASLTADNGGSTISAATFTNAGTVGITNGDGLTLAGTVANTGAIGVTSTGSTTTLTIAAAGVVLNGAGALTLSDSSDNIIVGAAYGATLTNVNNTISGAGNFGDGRLLLINAAAGVIDATGTATNALLINTGYGGGDSATNAGLIETTGAGGLTFTNTTLTNTGTVKSTGTGALTLSGATITGTGGVISTASGAHISLRSGAITGGSLSVVAGASLTADSGGSTITAATFTNAGTVGIINGDGLTVGGTVANTGAIGVTSTGSSTTLTIAAAGLVLNGAGALTLSDSSDNFIVGAAYGATLTNVNNTITGAGNFGDGRLLLINAAAGVIDATGTATNALLINTGYGGGDSATNAGLIETTGAGGLTFTNTTLTNTGTVKSTGTGALTLSGATITGTGGVISTASGAHISLRSGAITGGSLSVVAGASLTADNGSSSISAATFTNAGTVGITNGEGLTLAGTVANTGAIGVTSTGSSTTLTIAAAGLVLNGAGALTLSDSSDNFIVGAAYGATLTNVNNTITGAGNFGDGRLLLINDAGGVIDATGTATNALIINTGYSGGDSATNAGLIETTGAGGLTFSSTTLTNTGTVKATGTGALTLNSATIAGTGGVISTVSGAHISLRSGAITGGSLNVVAGASLTADNGSSTITAATFTNAGTVGITNGDGLTVAGTVANTGAIGLNSTGSGTALTIAAAGVVLNGGGALALSDSGGNIVVGAATGATLTNTNNTISGAGNLGNYQVALINQIAGVIDATGTTNALFIKSFGAASNAGLIETTGAGGLTLANFTTLTNTGTVKATGIGALTLNVATTIANGSTGVITTASGAHIILSRGTITGGSLNVVVGASLTANNGGSSIYGATFINAGSVGITNGCYLNLAGTVANTGAIGVNSTGSNTEIIIAAAGVVLSGAGTLTLSDNSNSYVIGGAYKATLTNASNTIAGAGALGGTFLNLINEANGVIDATGTTNALIINTGNSGGDSLSNAGLIEATGAGGLTFDGATTIANTGTVEAKGGVVDFVAGTALINGAGGELLVAAGALMEFKGGTLTNLAGTTLTGGIYAVDAGGTLQLPDNVSVTVDDAVIILSGAGSTMQSLNGGATEVTLESSLTSIGATGELEAVGGRGYVSANTIANAGTLALGGGSFTTGKVTDAAGSSLTGFGTFASVFADSGSVTASGGPLIFTATGNTFAGALVGGEIEFSGGTDKLGSGTTATASTIFSTGAVVLTLGTNLNFAGTWTQSTATVNLAGFTLTLSGTSTFTGATINGAGTLAFSGGTQSIGGATAIGATSWTLSGGASTTLGQNLAFTHAFGGGTGTTFSISGGDILTLSGASTFAGAINGAGSLLFSGGTEAINAGAAFGVASLSLASAALVNVNTSLTYAGAFSQAAATSLAIAAGDTLTVTGAASLAGTVSGAGTLLLDDAASAASTFDNAGTVVVGDGHSLGLSAGTLVNAGAISLIGAGHATHLDLAVAGVTFTGGGTVSVNGIGAQIEGLGAAAASLTNGETITGSGAIFAANLTLVNQAGGVINANGASAMTITTPGDVITNAGLLEATGAGGLVISGASINNAGGRISAGAGSTLSLQTTTITGAGVLVTAATGTIAVDNASVVQLQGVTANAGVIDVASTGSQTDLRILQAGATLTGGGTIVLSGAKDRILGFSPTSTLTNFDNTIAGTCIFGAANLLTLINESKGTIDATGVMTLDTSGATVTNAGLMESTTGGLLTVSATTINQSGGGTLNAAGGMINFTGADIIGGTIASTTGFAVRVLTGTNMLDGTTSAVNLTGTLQVLSTDTLTIVGTINNTGKLNPYGGTLMIGAGGAVLTGAGQVNLTANAANDITSTAAGATLTNAGNAIFGSGTIGGGTLTLVNQAAGVISNGLSVALTINTGSNTVINAGAIAATAAGGGVNVQSAVNNTGRLIANAGGTLTMNGAVTGAGIGQINGGELIIAQAFAENVFFLGKGVLELEDSTAYTGKIVGLSNAGTNSLDLTDITFTSGVTKATYSGTTASGTLTVTDGTHTANIKLIGNYTTAGAFVLSSDGHGGTTVVDPTPSTPAVLTQAMASFQIGAALSPAGPSPGTQTNLPLIAAHG